MALLRAPSQFAPGRSGGPVTPSCCGCCCCCCCAGTVAATTIALPLILHQVAPRPVDHHQGLQISAPPVGPHAPAAAEPADSSPALGTPTAAGARQPVGRGRRAAGIVTAALAVPLGILVAVGFALVITPSARFQLVVAAGFLAVAGIAVIGYRISGARTSVAVGTPIVVVLIALVLALLELVLWAAAIFGGDGSTARSQLPTVLGGIGIIAIPVVTTTMIIAVGRRRRRSPAS